MSTLAIWAKAKVRGQTVLVEDIQRRVAGALDLSPDRVEIQGYRTRYMSLFLQCWGLADGVRIFAKIFLVDLYPTPARYANPKEELTAEENPERPVEEQISVEWTRFQEMRRLMGPRNIPKPLGCSISHRTLVYEQVEGVRIDSFTNNHWANWLRPNRRDLASAEAAVLQSGKWLRALHGSTLRGFEEVDSGELAKTLQALIQKRQLEGSPYATLALKVFAIAGIDFECAASVSVPVAMNHGDFTLANLLWDVDRRKLWVIDFEQSEHRSILHDLSTVIFGLRKELLHPLAPSRVVSRCEKCFWEGYGEVTTKVFALVNALATARLFYHTLPKLRHWRDRRGACAGVKASVYAHVLQPFAVRRVLSLLSDSKRDRSVVATHSEIGGSSAIERTRQL